MIIIIKIITIIIIITTITITIKRGNKMNPEEKKTRIITNLRRVASASLEKMNSTSLFIHHLSLHHVMYFISFQPFCIVIFYISSRIIFLYLNANIE